MQLVAPLLEYVKMDASSHGDRTLTDAEARDRFTVNTSVRRLTLGRVLDGVERILATRGWPEVAAAGITAYAVHSGSAKPADGWVRARNMNLDDASDAARAYMQLLTLGPKADA
jgi:hypothetical protein